MAEEAGAATATDPESGHAPEGTTADGVESGKGGESGATNPIERIRKDPDFAEKQYKHIHSAYSQAREQINAAEPVLEAARTLGNGDLKSGIQAIQTHLQNYGSVRQNPALKRMVDTYLQTGKLQASSDDGDDEEPEEEDPTQAKIQALERRIDELTKGNAKTTIQRDIEKTVEEFPEEWRGRVMQAIDQNIRTWERQAESEDATARQQALNLLGSVNRKHLRTIAVNDLLDSDDIRQSELVKLARSLQSENLDHKRTLDTGDPGVRSTGREPDTRRSSAREAMEAARQKYPLEG